MFLKYLFIIIITCGSAARSFGQAARLREGKPGEIISRVIQIKKGQTLLNLPVNPSSNMLRAHIKSGGKDIAMFNIRLSVTPTFWTFFDVTDYQGKTLTIEIENAQQDIKVVTSGALNAAPLALPDEKSLNMIFSGNKYPGQDSLYRESDRPQVHFSSQRGHLNDPNGLVYYNHEFHLYYQHNPYGIDGGNQHWGHAVSKDMMHWVQLKEAIYPFLDLENGRRDLAYSGSATYDPKNTSGFRKNGIDPLIAFYTSTGRGECIKLSYDNGRTFAEYEGNPIIKHIGRDPKIFWYAPGNHWVLVVWDAGYPKKLSLGQEASVRQNSIYTSLDMKSWTYQSGIPGFFECPDFYELPVEGNPGVLKWVMSDANGRYMLGNFDGMNFKVDQQTKEYVYGGRYYYAAQTFNNMPDNRRVQIGWGNYNYPNMPFTQSMLFPNELRLIKASDGIRLCPTPIREIASLYKSSQLVENKVITAKGAVSIHVNPDSPIHIKAEFEKGDAPLSLNIMGYELRYDNEWQFTALPPPPLTGTITKANGHETSVQSAGITSIKYVKSDTNIFKIEAILDKNMLEVYVNDGELYYVTEFKGAKTGKVEAAITTAIRGATGFEGDTHKFILKKLEVHELNSIWPDPVLAKNKP